MAEFNHELIAKVRAGDKESFEIFVKSYTPYVYRTAFAFLHDPVEAEDVSQEIFLKIHRSISQLNDLHAFNSWLKKIITHSCLDHIKKQEPTPTPFLELDLGFHDTSLHWDQHLDILGALKNLNIEYRETLVLREWEGYSYEEIANILGVPVGTVKSRIHTARLQLRKTLSPGEL
ncbi:RNA polymerase sigma factor [Desulfosporosinus sp. BG]|uniref:RNA polymerase sigma factor n=1 Tax=Desulfosporosinus sp. BG TaxID=1633135 RepID=UPI000839E721|nr:RNA polymerase sigma factor [Desulfosporosinus sp. BG]